MAEKTEVKENPKDPDNNELIQKMKELCELPAQLTFRGARKLVMQRVWRRAELAEKAGRPLTPESFSAFLVQEWAALKTEIPKLKATYEKCLASASAKGGPQKKLSKDEVETRVEYFFEVKKRELLNDLGIQE
jgi:hypothetical protein